MTFRLRIDPVAHSEIDQFFAYARDYNQDFAVEQIERLERTLSVSIGASPLIWGYFVFTGPRYRAYLFRVGRRNQYWIIYVVDEDTRTIFCVSGMPRAIPKRWTCKRTYEL